MKSIALFICLTCAFSAWADTPATQPLAADVLVMPFTPIAFDGSDDSLPRSIQQNLIADLGRGHLRPVAPEDVATTDPLIAGHQAGVRFVITGTYQSADGLLRFSGQIIDVKSGSVVGGLTATGGPRDLFGIEDALSAQALHQLQKLNKQPVAAAVAGAKPPAAAQPATPAPAANPPTFMRAYEGSELQQYVADGRSPSQDYADQVRASANRQTNWSYGYSANGYGGYAYGYGYGYPWSGGYGYPYAYPYGFAYGYTTPYVVLRMTPQPAHFFGNDHSMRP